jgi:uncharacterized membrane protein
MKFPTWQKLVLPGVMLVMVLLTYWPVFSSARLPGGEMSDTVHQGYPFSSYMENSVRAGSLPHWNPYIFCGVPFYSSFSAPLFYPLRGLLLLTTGAEGMIRFTFPIHMFLGGIFAWLFLGSIGVSKAGRIIGALAFAGGSWANTLFYAGHGSKIICWSYLPLLLYSCEKWMETRRPVFLGLGGLSLGMQGLASHPQMILYSGGAAFLWLLARAVEARGKKTGRAVVCLAGIAILGGGIAAVQLLPGYNFSRYSSRGENLSVDQAASYSLPPEESLTMIFPHMFGLRHGFRDSSLTGAPVYFGRLGLRLSSEFLGVSVFLLSLMGFLYSRGRIRWPLLAIALSGLLVSWGGYTPVFKILYAIVPVFRKLRAPHMAAFLTTSSLSLMAGPGFDALFGKKPDRRKYIVLAVFSGICLLLFLFAAPLSRNLQSGWWTLMGLPGGAGFGQLIGHRTSMLGGDLIRASGVGIVFLFLLFAMKKFSLKPPVAAFALALLLAVELIPFNRSFQVYLPQTRIEQLFPDQPAMRELVGAGRVMPGGNELVPLSIRSVSGYHAAKPAVIDRLQSVLSRADLSIARQTAATVFAVEGTVLTYEEIRAAVLARFDESDSLLADSLSSILPEAPLPRVFFAGSWTAMENDRILDALSLGYSPDEITLLETDPGGLTETQTDSRGSAFITLDDPELVSIEVETDDAGLLVLADTWYPRWRVYVDGIESDLLRANYWQRAVVVPSGSHTVEFRFDSGDVRTGLLISIIGMLAVLVLSANEFIRKRRERE